MLADYWASKRDTQLPVPRSTGVSGGISLYTSKSHASVLTSTSKHIMDRQVRRHAPHFSLSPPKHV